jgi:hypothetical protein
MGPEETREQKAKVLLEYQETKEEIATLEVKAKRIGLEISKFGQWMQRSAAVNIYRKEQEQHGLPIEMMSWETLEAMKDWEKHFELADKLRQSRRRLTDLEEQKKQLHLQ